MEQDDEITVEMNIDNQNDPIIHVFHDNGYACDAGDGLEIVDFEPGAWVRYQFPDDPILLGDCFNVDMSYSHEIVNLTFNFATNRLFVVPILNQYELDSMMIDNTSDDFMKVYQCRDYKF